MDRGDSTYKGLLGLLVLSLFFFRWLYIAYGPLDLAPDEAHYWEWARRLDISYYSKGPLIAYTIALFTGLIGDTEVGVRIGAVLISTVLTLLLFHLSRDILKDDRGAFLASLLPHLTPLFAAGSVLMTTDPLLLLFWGLTIYLLYRAIFFGRGRLWYPAGIATGLGILGKYSMALIYPSILLYLLISQRGRVWLRRKEPYLALILSLVLVLPIFIWNYRHGWVGIRHVMGQAHVEEGFRISWKDFIEFLGSQAGILTPFIFLGLCYSMVKGLIEGLKGREEWLFLSTTSLPVLLFFVFKSLQGKVEANWAASAYFSAFPLTVGVMGGIYSRGRVWKGLILLSLLFGFLLTAISHYPAVLDLPPKKDPTTRLIGWQELGKAVGRLYEEEKDLFIVSNRYQVASELAFYVPGNPRVYNINLGRRMNQYDIWGGLEGLKGRDGLYVSWDRDPPVQVFERCEGPLVVDIKRRGRKVREFFIFRCDNFLGPIPVKEVSY